MPISEIHSARKARFQSVVADLRSVVSGGKLPADRRESAGLFLDALAAVLAGSGPANEQFHYLLAGAEVEAEGRARTAA